MKTLEQHPPEARAGGHVAASGRVQPVPRWWECILNFALVLWIVRVPLATTAFGWLLLGWTPQAQDLFVEFWNVPLWWKLWFPFVLTAVWAMPTHYASRMLIDSDPRFSGRGLNAAPCLKASAKYIPRLLGFLTFIAAEFAIWRSSANLPELDQVTVRNEAKGALLTMALLVAAGAAVYVVWVIKRPRNFVLPGWLGRLNAALGTFWQAFSPGRVRGARDEESRDIGRLVLAGMFVIFLVIFLLGGDRAGAIFPRAIAVPFILGGWLPFLSYLSGLGRQLRAPLITGLIVLVALLAVVLGDNHSVRRIASGNLAPLPLKDAVDLWMTENGCNPKVQGAAATPCPRPIIVAAAGGASRAGFFMASIIGYFLDPLDTARHELSIKDVRNRIFAISSVSGGSMGAVMVAAALNVAPPDSDRPPCVRRAVDQWWGITVNNWRDCFEALTSGDFLTADFFGLAFNDMLPFAMLAFGSRDRAAVLEDSWTNRFREVVLAANKNADPSARQGLDAPFLTLRPRPGHWIPLLVLNGTSEATGQRILTTSVAMTYTPAKGCPTAVASASCPLFVQADSFHQLLKTKVTAERWSDRLGFLERYRLRRIGGDDVQVSTAAHNSARFPFISPPGSIRNNQDQVIIDRIVDGGYFENYGALAAKELALAVHAVEPQLKPLVIVISNDPADFLDPADDSTSDQHGPPRPRATAGELLSEANAPITTFANARTAHGVLAVDQLWTTLHAAIPECSKLMIQVRVWPDGAKNLSMSWWESPLVQRRLHRQTEQEPNSAKGADKNQNLRHLEAIWQEMKASSCK